VPLITGVEPLASAAGVAVPGTNTTYLTLVSSRVPREE
jgi:hypothetical protein